MQEGTPTHPLPGTGTLSVHHLIESLLFVTDEPVSINDLARLLEYPPDTIETALVRLNDDYRGRGIRLQRHDDHVQLVSAPEAAPMIARFLGAQASPRLSNAALEVLAIIAYRQPQTRSQIEAIRGVDSSGVLRALQERKLIVEVGRQETAGRPILYATTSEFLQQFGLSSLAELPELPPLDESPISPPPEHT
jgi:segregation and condensation protein B